MHDRTVPPFPTDSKRDRVAAIRGRRLLLAALVLGFSRMLTAEGLPEGLVVDQAAAAAERAGIRAGDVLLSWRREDGASGPLRSPLDLARVEIEEAPRGATELVGLRGDTRFALPVRGTSWGIDARPVFAGPVLEAWLEGRQAASAGDTAGQVAAWERAATLLEEDELALAAAWAWARLAEIDPLAAASRKRFDRALALATGAPPEVEAILWEWRARSLERTQDAGAAEEAWQRAIELRERALPDGRLALANDLYLLGSLKGRRGDLEVSGDLLERALHLRRELAPGSLHEAEALTATGIAAALHGDLERAAERFEQALRIAQGSDPEGGETAAALNALGNVAHQRGRLADAEQYYRRALAINEKIAPDSLNVSFQLNNLGFMAELRGDLSRAEELYRRSLAIREETAPGTIHVPRAIDNLAFVAFARGELERARELHERALPLYEALAPGSLVVSTSLKLLANVSLEAGDADAAQTWFERARELERDIAPETISYAEILVGLGRAAAARGENDAAGALYSEALALSSRIAPGGLPVAEALVRLGELAVERGDYADARERYAAAVTIRSQLAPGTAEEADALHALGTVLRAGAEDRAALEYFLAALDAIEAQRGKLGGSEVVRTRFAARYGHLYKRTIELMLELGQPEAAFAVLERYRARGLLAMLAERDLLLDRDLPDDIAAARSTLRAEYDRLSEHLATLDDSPEHSAEVDAARAALRALHEERERLAQRVRAVSPRLAAAESPRPLDLEAMRRNLDTGTALLSYAVAEDASWLFVLAGVADESAPVLEVFRIDLGEAALEEEISAFRVLLRAPGAGDSSLRALIKRSASLHAALVAPAGELLAGSERLFVIPDGPLHLLPFAALVREPPDEGAPPRWLVESHAIHTAVSATVQAELSRHAAHRPGTPRDTTLVAFADPDGTAYAGAWRGGEPRALPYARREVKSIAALYRPASRLYVGEDASEARAKAIDRDTGLLHFASHAMLDPELPLDSYLLLAAGPAAGGGLENGLLQAWEIFEQVRVDAELVTLSACDTGSGAYGGGEGLIGLTQAFHYAGARAVLASLWPVADRSTSVLMRRFYRNLEGGMRKDEALRAAQLSLIRGESGGDGWLTRMLESPPSDLSHPFHWAGFQLSGDAR